MPRRRRYRSKGDGNGSESDREVATGVPFAVGNLFLNAAFSDMAIVCGDQTLVAHRAIVCSQSPFFLAALTSGFQETTTATVELPEDDPETVKLFLEFLYKGDYTYHKEDIEASDTGSDTSNATRAISRNMHTALSLYIIADKFDVPSLKVLAAERFEAWARRAWQDASEFPSVVDRIYSNTVHNDTRLREAVCCLIIRRARNQAEIMKRFTPVMQKHTEFMEDAFKYALKSGRQKDR